MVQMQRGFLSECTSFEVVARKLKGQEASLAVFAVVLRVSPEWRAFVAPGSRSMPKVRPSGFVVDFVRGASNGRQG